jgi:hypothetical protein
MSGTKVEEMRGGWRKLQDEELQNFYWTLYILLSSLNNEDMDETCSTHWGA